MLFKNATIYTMEQDPFVGDFRIDKGVFTEIGKDLSPKDEEVQDLNGLYVFPGLIDAHSHYINALSVAHQAKLYAPPAGPGQDVPSIIAALQRFALERKIAPGEMIMGYGYDDTVMPQGRLLNRDDLDRAFPNHPVRVDHVSMHGTVLNTLAQKFYGIGADTQTPDGGIIVRKPGTNEPYGLIMETAFLPIFEKAALNRPGFCRQSRASYFLSNRSPYEQSTLPRRIQDRGGQTNP